MYHHHESIAPVPPNIINEMPQSTSKKKRKLPGNPDPEAEVVALSPGALMATNRFVCEICNKGFQRDQNLQLHRRGHNLPWKLMKQKNVKKRVVYVCPDTSCVHHHPSRALGDLTGIKKHFSRKHGEKKWKCDKCSKRYALQSDWKAHSKICGTRDYRCDCGTLFSRRDSFITHRAFCDILAEDSSKSITQLQNPLFNSNTSQTPPNNFNNHLPQWLSSPEPGVATPRVEQSISPNPNNYNMSSSPSPMSATALLQKATHEMGVTMSSSTKAGPHMGAPRFYATTTTANMTAGLPTCEEMGTGFVNVTSSCMQNIQEINSNGILNQKKNGSEHLVGGGGGGGGDDGLPTRDFLGLRGFPDRDLFGLHQMGTSSNYHHDNAQNNQAQWHHG
ncbi:hypothetical protein ACJIZ3_004853 [Penstemon smallii]|uniref:C2H2-type domain-containing protein n=1 Tax=Penstemon smallii TaxID=265156 RepID=A0ABD3S375_9LAMI